MSNQRNQNIDDEIADKLREFRLKNGMPADGMYGKAFRKEAAVSVTVLAPNKWTRIEDERPPQMTWVWGRTDRHYAILMFYRTKRFFIDDTSGSISNRHPESDAVYEWIVLEEADDKG